ncbi:protein phosphatase 2C domain-containing protein [Sutcliffiella halmapala]|uniref:protein phosphatase 2C domain-containing protein n=1 Tax=Sutcliffiella halmapala TaxID=79882 RepID=UPI00099526EA|nr:protein phosphatase 2C domain-containing protein [Sutcliffiella halmapala]
MDKSNREFSWVGSQESFVDRPIINRFNHMVVGRYGGNSSAGQYKNEDGCLIWFDEKEDWEFAIILDAHNTAESAEIVLEEFIKKKTEVIYLFAQPITQVFGELEEMVLDIFQDEEFLTACRKIKGETACLIVARKDKYVWWFSVGDCILYLFHEELAALGQYQLNQRHFFEWIGQVNTFDQSVPCYSSGRKELRKGINHLLLTTDGLIECPNEPFSNPQDIAKIFSNSQDDKAMMSLLEKIQENNVRDSTTMISWKVNIEKEASKPSDL